MVDRAYEALRAARGATWEQWVTPPPPNASAFHRDLHTHTPDITDTAAPPYDPFFRIVVPLSGGLDSTTAYEMAREGGLPVEGLYVDTGASYSGVEQASLDFRRYQYERVALDVDYERDGVVDSGRNAVILWTAAEWMKRNGWWGEVWFGGHLGPGGESPVRYGDKSHRFLLDLNQILTLRTFDVRVSTPLAGLTKADMVAWWLRHRTEAAALRTFSCFDTDGDVKRCGRCPACFKWWAAFAANEIATHDLPMWRNRPKFPAEYKTMLQRRPLAVEYAWGRMAWIERALRRYGNEVLEG